MKTLSLLTGKYYEREDCRYIPNMQQNYKYLASGRANDQLVDIICGEQQRLVFVWRKSKIMNELYQLWCDRIL